jgi:hypothetical protein
VPYRQLVVNPAKKRTTRVANASLRSQALRCPLVRLRGGCWPWAVRRAVDLTQRFSCGGVAERTNAAVLKLAAIHVSASDRTFATLQTCCTVTLGAGVSHSVSHRFGLAPAVLVRTRNARRRAVWCVCGAPGQGVNSTVTGSPCVTSRTVRSPSASARVTVAVRRAPTKVHGPAKGLGCSMTMTTTAVEDSTASAL